MSNHAIAVKAFIIKDGKLLLLKRRPNDPNKPGTWDIPGGRLDPGENPHAGVQREALEEAGLKIAVHVPIDIHHFTRDDGQLITMIIFLCTLEDESITLSEEHTESNWEPLESSLELFPSWLEPVIGNVKNYKLVDGIQKKV